MSLQSYRTGPVEERKYFGLRYIYGISERAPALTCKWLVLQACVAVQHNDPTATCTARVCVALKCLARRGMIQLASVRCNAALAAAFSPLLPARPLMCVKHSLYCFMMGRKERMGTS